MAFTGLDELITSIIKWEKDFDSFYDLLEDFLKDEKSRKVAKLLQDRHEEILGVLEEIKLEDYKNTELIKFVPEDHEGERFEIDANASLDEVFDRILDHEEQRIKYYKRLKDVCAFEKSRDFFEMIIGLKTRQVKEITQLMDSQNLAM